MHLVAHLLSGRLLERTLRSRRLQIEFGMAPGSDKVRPHETCLLTKQAATFKSSLELASDKTWLLLRCVFRMCFGVRTSFEATHHLKQAQGWESRLPALFRCSVWRRNIAFVLLIGTCAFVVWGSESISCGVEPFLCWRSCFVVVSSGWRFCVLVPPWLLVICYIITI